MSEYQYYEFQALDRPLSAAEMDRLRAASSRASITSTRFVNEYSYGSFKGNESEWMQKYFDAFLYVANWGTHQLQLRLPRRVLAPETAKRYLQGRSASARSKGDFVLLSFLSEEEEGGWVEGEEASEWMSSLIPTRAELASGDHRMLYLGWLLSAQTGELKDDAPEPPVPAGLGKLSLPLQSFSEFLRIDEGLIAAAAERSATLDDSKTSRAELSRWISAVPEKEKTELLLRVATGEEAHARAQLLQAFRKSRLPAETSESSRTVRDLLSGADRRAEGRRAAEAERARREKARREKAEAAERERYLDALAARAPALWTQVEAMIATKKPGEYDKALRLLGDLREVGARTGQLAEVDERLQRIHDQHSKKTRFIKRMRDAGLLPHLDRLL